MKISSPLFLPMGILGIGLLFDQVSMKTVLNSQFPINLTHESAPRNTDESAYDNASEWYLYANICGLSCGNVEKDDSQVDGFKHTASVGSFKPKKLGLYDMTGNVWEWCQDWHHDSYIGVPVDGSTWLKPIGTRCVVQGGSWCSIPIYNSIAISDSNRRFNKSYYKIGYRLARSVKKKI